MKDTIEKTQQLREEITDKDDQMIKGSRMVKVQNRQEFDELLRDYITKKAKVLNEVTRGDIHTGREKPIKNIEPKIHRRYTKAKKDTTPYWMKSWIR